ncbi:MAG: hypothetical protein ACRDJH_04165 [Thermomicrobiales bacterium]
MPRWALILIVAPLALCVSCASIGYLVVWPRVQASVSDPLAETMADAVFTSVSGRIAASAFQSGDLVLTAADLDVNNTVVPGEAGFETSTDGAWIYGVVTKISPAGVTLLLPGVTYGGMPVIEESRVELTEITAADNLLGFVLTEDVFEQGMEEGINRALDEHGLTPTAITLRHGSMTILTVLTAGTRDVRARVDGPSSNTLNTWGNGRTEGVLW